MNKIYKLVWSKARNMYVAVAEIARSHTKGPKSGVISHTVAAGVLAAVIACGAVMPAYAEAPGIGINNLNTEAVNYDGSGAMGYDSIAIGDAKAAGGGSVAVGADALTTGVNAIAIGAGSTATGDGTTREQINAILSNNKAIRDGVNEARGAYTISEQDYLRQKEIFDGQNEAVARVNHANELIAGYQAEINNTLQPNANTANDAYNTAKTDYDTLYNDFASRLAEFSKIQFDLYTNTSSGNVDLDAMAADLKTQTEEGTSINMSQGFYRNYIDNYIVVQGDLRQNAIIYNKCANSVLFDGDTYSYNTYEKLRNEALEGTSKTLYFNLMGGGRYPTDLKTVYDAVVGEDKLDSRVVSFFFPDRDRQQQFGINTSNGTLSYKTADGTVHGPSAGGGTKICIGAYGVEGANGVEGEGLMYSGYMKSAPRIVSALDSTKVLNDSEFNTFMTNVDNIINSWVNKDYSSDTTYNKIIGAYEGAYNTGLITLDELNNVKSGFKLSNNYLNYCSDLLHLQGNIYHEQYLYEKFKSEGNEAQALVHLGNKGNYESQYNTLMANPVNTYNDVNISNYNYVNSCNPIYIPYVDKIQSQVIETIGGFIYNGIYQPIKNVNVTLSAVSDLLEGELADKKAALNSATTAKNAADQALADKQQQIANTQPTQQDLDDAAAAEASAQELQQKKDKLDADKAALEAAKANLVNLETIASDGENAIAIGGNAISTGNAGIGIGADVIVTGENAVGIGKNTIASGKNSVAVGPSNSVAKENGVAVGNNNGVTGMNSIAIGTGNVVSGAGSVAIGNGLNVTEDNVVVLGGKKMTAMADGTVGLNSTDAVTGNQLYQETRFVNVNTEKTEGDGATGTDSVAVGIDSKVTGDLSTSIGNTNTITGKNSIAVGTGHTVSGNSSGAIGDPNIVNGDNSYAVGNNTTIAAGTADVFVLGNNVNATASNTVVLGSNSDGSQANTVSVGSAAQKRRIVNVANGTSATDAATMGQTIELVAGDNVTVTADGTNDAGQKKFKISSTGSNGDIDYADEYHSQVILDGSAYSNSDGNPQDGTILSGLKDGLLSATSNEAVTGAQLYETNNNLADTNTALSQTNATVASMQTDVTTLKTNYTVLRSEYNTTKTQVETGFNVTANGAKVKTVNPDSNYIDFKAGDGITITNDNGAVKITNSIQADGQVASGDTKVVSGDTVYNEVRPATDGEYVKTASTTGVNLLALDTQVKANADAIDALDDSAVQYDGVDKSKVTLVGTGGTTIDNLKDGTLSATSKEAVNGSQLFTTNQNLATETAAREAADTVLSDRIGTLFADGNYILKDNDVSTNLSTLDTAIKGLADDKANTGLDNITDGGKTVIRDLAKESVKVIAGEHTTVTEGTDGDAKTYAVNVAMDGQVAEGNEGVVSGGDVFDAIKDAKEEVTNATDTKLEGYAKIDGSNVTTPATWGEKLGTGEVEANNGELVTGGTVYNALNDAVTNINTALDGKANADASNIGIHAATDNSVAWGNAIGTGAVAMSDHRLVTGGTVYNEVRPDSDGTIVKVANTTGQNLLALDASVANLRAMSEDAVVYDAADHNKVTLTANSIAGTTLTNVRAGVISKASRDAINGGQLWSVKQDIEGFAEDIRRNANSIQTLNGSVSNALASVAAANTLVNTVNDLKADASLNNLSAAGKQVISSAAMDAVQQYMAAQGGNSGNGTNSTVDPNMSTNYYTVNVADLIDDLSGDGSAVNGFKKTDNASLLGTSLRTMNPSDTTTNYVVYDDADATQITLEDSTGEGTKITNLAEGSLSAASTDAVNGSQLYKTNRDIAAMQETLSTNNGTVAALQTDTQTLKTNMITLQSQYATTKTQVETGFNVTVDGAKVKTVNPDSAYMDFVTGDHTEIVNDNGSVRVNVKDDGQIADGDTGLVTGDTVYEAIKGFGTSAAMEGKANVALDNLTDEGKDVIRDLAKASVKVVGGTNADVVKTSVEGVDTYTVNVLTNGVVEDGNTGVVNGDAVYDAIQAAKDDVTDATDTKLEGYAKIDGSNVTTPATWGQKLGTGAVTEGNGELVTGGTVYNAIQGTVADFDGKLSGYAKKDASNVDAGVWGNKLGTGKVSASDGKLVSGKTVAGETRVADNGNYILKDNSAAQNLNVLDTVLKETRDIAEAAAAAGTDANAVHYDGSDKSSITLEGVDGTKITNLSDGEVSATSTDAVTGKQLFETNEKLDALDTRVGTVTDGNYVSADKSIGENVNALDGQLKTVSDGLDTVRTDVATLRTDVDDLNDKVAGFETELDGKADTDLGNLTDTGKTVISGIAKESVKVKGTGLAKVTSAEEGKATVYTVNVQANGKVEENNADLVNGGTVYNSINAVRNEFAEGLDGKADTDLSNITVNGKNVIREAVKADLDKKADKADLNKKANVDASNIQVDAWAAKLGVGEIAEGNTGLVNGGTVYDAIQKVDRNNNIVEIQDDIIYMGAREGGNVISIYNNEGEGRVITGVATNPSDPSSAANVGYVNAVGENIVVRVDQGLSKVNDRVNKVGASAAAMASLMPAPMDGDEKWSLSAAVGNYRNSTAGAVGAFYRPQDNVMINLRGSFGNDENMIGGGVSVALNKGNTPGVSKAQLIRAMNAQAATISSQERKIAEQDSRIAGLEAMVQQFMKQANSTEQNNG